MSQTSAPPPSRAAVRAPAAPTAYSLPLHMLRIFGSRAVSLVLWFSAGRAIRAGLMWAGTDVSHGDHRQVRLVVTMLIFTLIVLNELVVMVGMLHSVRGALREIRVRRAGDEADESLFGALNRATLVFATIYLAWSFHAEDAREFVALDRTRNAGEDLLLRPLIGEESTTGTGLIGLDVRLSIVIAVVAYLLRGLFGWWHAQGRVKGSGVLTTFFELAFAFYGINAVLAFVEARSDWVSHRVVVDALGDQVKQLEESVPGWKEAAAWIGEVWPYVVDALIEPLTWLTVAALVYGAFAEDTRSVVRGTRLDAVADRMERTHSLTRSVATRMTTGFQERWVPPVNAFRLAARGGAALFGMFCLCYVLVRVGADYTTQGVKMLIGNPEPFSWVAWGSAASVLRDLVVDTLTVCLLAATFDIAATRARESGRTVGD
ncbi:hypothetical protein AB0D67_25755 [Streptosporangium sp. NPDC048047]|uniref:hypothetical protein n=1 Tax=Streptosporangium sp. NPDC048047 TaxID=3155748 RepID=UPI0034286B65